MEFSQPPRPTRNAPIITIAIETICMLFASYWRNLENRALALDSVRKVGVEFSAFLETHFGGEGGVWLPLGGGTWIGLFHHLVHLLERQSLQ